ncbi:MAG: PD-(D/E)XK nuclease family protein [Thermoplasmata archaeon]|nr:PD-(D/E)XK nuclease family protein [Thermoplasmata archaeon]
MISPIDGVALLVALVVLILSLRALTALRRDRALGTLRSIDDGPTRTTLYAPRYGLSGRPDAVRTLPDGRTVPVEIKSRNAPSREPPMSHRVQVEAYCLLLEETTGRAPPFGVLRYSDGREWRMPWDSTARAEVLNLLDAVRRRYDGHATPSPAKCARCPWQPSCDVRAA